MADDKSFFSRHKYWTALGVLVIAGAVAGMGIYSR